MPFSLQLPTPFCYGLTRLLRRVRPTSRSAEVFDQAAYFRRQYESTDRLRERFMAGIPFEGRTVLDLGSGLGGRAPRWLDYGAERVWAIDVNRQELEAGRAILSAQFPQYAARVEWCHPDDAPSGPLADTAVLVDCFEHLVEPAAVLKRLADRLRPGGCAWIGSFAWYHHAASHCGFHVPIPWSQVLFSERAIIRTIQRVVRQPDYELTFWERREGIQRWDQVRTLRDRPGEPLNQLSLRGVRRVLAQSPLRLESFQVWTYSAAAGPLARALGGMARLPLFDELFHSYYTALLRKPT